MATDSAKSTGSEKRQFVKVGGRSTRVSPFRLTDQRGSSWIVALYFAFKLLPMLLGGFSIWLGYRLFILGVTGQASLSIASKTLSGQLINAAPGLFFAVGGVAIVIVAVWKGSKLRQQTPFETLEVMAYDAKDALKLDWNDWNGWSM